MPRHVRRFGAIYVLAALFVGSWAGQHVAMTAAGQADEFWAATFENWQSEWLQLFFQAVLLMALKHWLWQIEAEDQERLESKVDEIRAVLGLREHLRDPR